MYGYLDNQNEGLEKALIEPISVSLWCLKTKTSISTTSLSENNHVYISNQIVTLW